MKIQNKMKFVRVLLKLVDNKRINLNKNYLDKKKSIVY